MRSSILSRSVIAVASLAIGSVALAAAPATAAVPAGVTRDMVLIAGQGFFANEGAQQSPPENVIENFESLISLSCDFVAGDGDSIHDYNFQPFVNGAADGILITVQLHEPSAQDETTDRWCTFAALAATTPGFTLNGNASVTLTGDGVDTESAPLTETSTGTALSGNVYVTEPINVDNDFNPRSASVTTSGNATGPANVTTTKEITTPKSKSAKKAAKKAYDKKLQKAKKAYKKALHKAGKSKSKKAAAKKAWAKRKAAYKAAYRKSIVTVTTVPTTTVQTVNRPFSVNTGFEIVDAE